MPGVQTLTARAAGSAGGRCGAFCAVPSLDTRLFGPLLGMRVGVVLDIMY